MTYFIEGRPNKLLLGIQESYQFLRCIQCVGTKIRGWKTKKTYSIGAKNYTIPMKFINYAFTLSSDH